MSDSRKVELENEFKLTGDFPVTSYNEWKEKAERDLQGASFEKMLFTGTYEGITFIQRAILKIPPQRVNYPDSQIFHGEPGLPATKGNHGR